MLNHMFGKIFGVAVGCPCEENLFDFALDGLDKKTQAKVRSHLSDCPRCRDQVKDYAWVSEGIALTAPQAEPPADLCDKVKSRIRSDASGKVEYRVLPLAGWPLFWMRLGPVFAGTSVLMSLAALSAFYSFPKGTHPALQSAEAKQVPLLGQGDGASSAGRLVFEAGRDTVLVRVLNLKACPVGKSYTLWKLSGSTAQRMGSFAADGGKDCSYFVQLSQPFQVESKPEVFEVTLEDSAQAALHPGPLYMLGEL